MGTGYEYRCDQCDHKVETSGLWEYYCDPRGRRKPYGHPAPISIEAAQMGVHGLDARVYCLQCDEIASTMKGITSKQECPPA